MRSLMTMTAVASVMIASTASAQLFVGPGSTVEGDYLRGAGVAYIGLGQYNLNTAQATNILANTAIMLDAYQRSVIANESRERARRRALRLTEHIKRYTAIRDRVLNTPDPSDIAAANAHNALMIWLSTEQSSVIRLNPIILPADVVRRIPYKLDKEGAVFSLPRLTHMGKAAWPVAFQDDEFDRERRAYQRAMSRALDAQIEGKMTDAVIDQVDAAIEDLERKLRAGKSANDPDRYGPAAIHLRELRSSFKQLKSVHIERAIAALDSYTGATVDDLRKFMADHNLGFAVPVTPEEKASYRELYAALSAQREAIDPQSRRAR